MALFFVALLYVALLYVAFGDNERLIDDTSTGFQESEIRQITCSCIIMIVLPTESENATPAAAKSPPRSLIRLFSCTCVWQYQNEEQPSRINMNLFKQWSYSGFWHRGYVKNAISFIDLEPNLSIRKLCFNVASGKPAQLAGRNLAV